MGVLSLTAFAGTIKIAHAHPHVFAEARFDVVVGRQGTVEKLRHLWRFDEVFSSTVILEFDANGDLTLDADELEAASEVMHQSLGEYNYFQMITANGATIEMKRPERLMASMENNQLIVFFETAPAEPLKLSGKLVFGVYDPTFYTAIDFTDDTYMAVESMPAHCSRTVIRPDPDEAIAENQAALTEAFFNDPTDLSKLFATRLQLDC
ncbi:DUF1007 family protein [Rhizobium wenxiniae]